MNLVVCRPFALSAITDASLFSYYFVDPANLDYPTMRSVATNYSKLLLEKEIATRFRENDQALPPNADVLDEIVEEKVGEGHRPRILLLASNDTHAHFMIRIAKRFQDVLFVIPKLSCKDEGACQRLGEHGIKYVEIDYADRESKEIAEFCPDVLFCANDWTSEFIALHAVALRLSVPSIVLQEGPQDWRMKIKGVDPRKYRNAEILFAQGARTLKYIRHKYFAVSGNPKVDHLEDIPLPPHLRVFINCNFTYGQWEDSRGMWMRDVLSTCQDLGLDYIISKHPRDRSVWDDPNVVESSTFSVRDQLVSCSIAVSRFSNIPYEALAVGRLVVYYNPHGETPRTFNEDSSGGIRKAFDRKELRSILLQHKRRMNFNKKSAAAFMHDHCGPMDGRSLDRIVYLINGIGASRMVNHDVIANKGRQLLELYGEILFSVVICTHNRANVLDMVLRSLLKTPQGRIHYEILVINNASTDNTRETVKPYLGSGAVHYILEPELGLARARNTGLRNARGKYVAFLDDDGEVTEGWLEAFLQVFETHDDAAACGGRIVPKYDIPRPVWITGISERYYGDYHLADEITLCEWIPGGNSAWKREVLEHLGGFDTRFGRRGGLPVMGGEESVLIKCALAGGYRLYYVPNALIFHHISRDRITLSYLGLRHFGQGITEVRYGVAEKRLSRRASRRLMISSLREAFRIMLVTTKHLMLKRKNRAIMQFFEFLYRIGLAVEAARYSLMGRL